MDYTEIFNDSYERLFSTSLRTESNSTRNFFDIFYRHFLQSSPKVANAFQHSDMDAQKTMLKRSLFFAVGFIANDEAHEFMKRIADIHSRADRNISPELYELWMDCIIKTLEECDPHYNREVGLAWRVTLAPAIAYMKAMH